MQTCIHAYVHTYIRAYMHTCMAAVGSVGAPVSLMWSALFGPKKPANEHNIKVRFQPGWTAGFIDDYSRHMPSKWLQDSEEWEAVSSLAWQNILRSIEDCLQCEESKPVLKKIRWALKGFEASFRSEVQRMSSDREPLRLTLGRLIQDLAQVW